MDFFTKNRMTMWSIIILVILNIFTLGTLWLQHFKPLPFSMGPDHKPHRNVQNFLRNELNLSEEQLQQFKNLRKQHFEQSRFIMHEIRELKKEMMDELFESTPDTSKLEQLANELGKRQTELEKLTSNHFLDLKSVCQVHQRRKLRALLHEFFGPPQHRMTPPRNKPGL